MHQCLCHVKQWMCSNQLKMNDTKTEFISFGTRQQLAKFSLSEINVGSEQVSSSSEVKYLGIWLDRELSLEKHISEKCKTASHSLYNIRKMRNYLDFNSIQTIIKALVISHLDYGNALFYGLLKKDNENAAKDPK